MDLQQKQSRQKERVIRKEFLNIDHSWSTGNQNLIGFGLLFSSEVTPISCPKPYFDQSWTYQLTLASLVNKSHT